MKKSKKVSAGLTLLVGTSLLVGGCTHKNTMYQQCTDAKGRVVEDRYCMNTTHTAGAVGAGYFAYRWYYSGSRYGVGSTVTGGSYVRPVGKTVSVTKSSAVKSSTSRGIFGKSSFGRGGGS
jgi:hypothetical protein